MPIGAQLGTPRAFTINQSGPQTHGRDARQGLAGAFVGGPHGVGTPVQIEGGGGLPQPLATAGLHALELGFHALVALNGQDAPSVRAVHQADVVGKLAEKSSDIQAVRARSPFQTSVQAV